MNSIGSYGGGCRFSLLTLAGLSALLHQLRDYAGPSGLVAGSNSGSRIAVEVLMEQNQIAPVRIGLELFEIAEHRPAAFFIAKKNVRHAARQFSRHFPQGHCLSRSGGELNLKVVAQVVMKLLERLDQQVVQREPNGATPVGIPAEQSSRRLAGVIIHAVLHPVHMKEIGVDAMEL